MTVNDAEKRYFGKEHSKDGGNHDNQNKNPPDTPRKSLRFSRKLINNKRREYLDSSTVHGLARISSESRIESCLWTIIVICAILASTWLTYSIVTNYLEYHIYAEVTTSLQVENPFPSITVCDLRSMIQQYFSYCNKKQGQRYDNYRQPCMEEIRPPKPRSNILNITGQWSNGIFHVLACYTWGGKTCTNDVYLKSLAQFDHSCVTLNHNGDLSDAYAHAHIEFQINTTALKRTPFIVAIVHDPQIGVEFDLTNRFVLETSKSFEFNIRKTIIKRLPPPFPSKCTSEKFNDIFPGKYTRRTCLESSTYLRTFKKCGDIFDYFKKYIPEDYVRLYRQNRTILEVLQCVQQESAQVQSGVNCPFPCEETEYMTRLLSYDNPPNSPGGQNRYRLDIQYSSIDSYQMIEEKQLHTLDHVAGKIGGLISLVLGASFISVIEIGFYLVLSCLYYGKRTLGRLPKPF
ncbi:acid-sensing ion channel 5-like [Clytia hemisphaerica]